MYVSKQLQGTHAWIGITVPSLPAITARQQQLVIIIIIIIIITLNLKFVSPCIIIQFKQITN
jgi:hypothetical protein